MNLEQRLSKAVLSAAILAGLSACTSTTDADGARAAKPDQNKVAEHKDDGSEVAKPVENRRVEDGFFLVDGAPDPRACEAAADCIGDTVPDENGCCQDPARVVPHARSYRRFITDWRKNACADVTCPPPPSPSLPPRCVFEVRCVEGQCVDSCPPAWLPPLDTTCSSDAECSATQQFYETEVACCRSCSTMVATPAWIEEATRICGERGAEGCPMKKCAALDAAVCVDGHCQAVPRDR